MEAQTELQVEHPHLAILFIIHQLKPHQEINNSNANAITVRGHRIGMMRRGRQRILILSTKTPICRTEPQILLHL